MHWNVPPDALPGSATYVRVLDRWLMDCTCHMYDSLSSLLYMIIIRWVCGLMNKSGKIESNNHEGYVTLYYKTIQCPFSVLTCSPDVIEVEGSGSLDFKH